jgi:RND family efflux transporter MFP subunit
LFETTDSLKLAKDLEEAERRYREAEERYRNGMMTEEDFVRVRREYEVEMAYARAHRSDVIANKSGLSSAREQYERAKMNVALTQIRAPFSGYVADCDVRPAMHIQAGTELMKFVDVSRMYVDVEVLESEIAALREGGNAEVSLTAYAGETFKGSIVAINPLVDAKTRTIRVTVELKPGEKSKGDGAQGRLRAGMFATVKIDAHVFRDRLFVPKEALLMRDQRALVFVAQHGVAKWHYVDLGEENEEFIEIKSGIAVGDTVIVDGHYTLAHDARVRIEGNK